jgi:hypothetical protein
VAICQLLNGSVLLMSGGFPYSAGALAGNYHTSAEIRSRQSEAFPEFIVVGTWEHSHVVVVENWALYVSPGSDGDGCDPHCPVLRADDAGFVGSLRDATYPIALESICSNAAS